MKVRSVVTGTASALVIGVGALALGACATPADTTGTSQAGAAGDTGTDSDTIALVSAATDMPAALTPQASDPGVGASSGDGQGDRDGRKGLRARLLRALHATWVTESKTGPVTHQAVRGEVTAVSGTSITVKAKDGFSLTFSVSSDTKVRARTRGTGGQKGTGSDSTIGAVKVGAKALVVGVGASDPKARVVIFLTGTPAPSSSSGSSS